MVDRIIYIGLAALFAGFGLGMKVHYELVEDQLTAPDTVRTPYEAAPALRDSLHKCLADRQLMLARLKQHGDHDWREAMGDE